MTGANNLFVSGLPVTVTEEAVREMFSEFGEIKSLTLRKPQLPPSPHLQMMAAMQTTCVAYVTFETEEQAKASFALNKRYAMTKLKVQFYKKEKQPLIVKDLGSEVSYLTLFLHRLDKKVTHQELRAVCEKYGTVTNVNLMMGQDKWGNSISLGKATVSY